MTNFFTQIAENLKDRQELRFTIKKIEGDLVVVVAPNFKEEGQNLEMSGSPAEIDENFFPELKKPMDVVNNGFTSNAEEVAAELKEDAKEEKGPAKKESETKKATAKKAAPKKAAKKSTAKPEVEAEEEEEEEKEEESSDENTSEESVEKVEEKAETEVAPVTPEETKQEPEPEPKQEVESGPSPKELFEHFMAEGKRLFDDRKYKESEEAYRSASELFPEDDKAAKALANATKWVKAIENLNKKGE